ncbi:glycosyl hydrolase family 28 protein [uncultured Bacteroides sp.]|uniref:rhamnogalacturonidase n=1 Tax=uncultured Bacteroides sp. TaxID=162156 RepID=UPI00262BD642|nr:glycosyl hydrolase family 28 protein [uncultured Bacteroides sp.]
MKFITLLFATFISLQTFGQEKFPDGTPIPDWFRQNEIVNIETLGGKYKITDHGVANDSTLLQTEKIQAVIDQVSQKGGGVIIVPKGTFLSGSLFFKPKTHLHLEEGAVLKGSDDISHFSIVDTRIEGQSLPYFAALVNADKVDGFTISGKGTINGNGERYWKSFWLRRKVIPKCTNMDELRPRLIFISNSNDVQLSGVHFINSPFWTTHLYRCNNIKLLNLHILAPSAPVKAPSSDAIDIDVCNNVLIKNCYMSVNDDAVAMKGGKGPWADKEPNNGGNTNVIIEDCTYGFCHSVLTFGSESIYNRNIILRRCKVSNASRLLWLKMRPDTPQHYEYILVEDITGNAKSFLYIKPWTQFFDLKGRKDMPLSHSNNVTMRNINFDCDVFFNVNKSDQYQLKDFTFENLNIKTRDAKCEKEIISNFKWEKVKVTH